MLHRRLEWQEKIIFIKIVEKKTFNEMFKQFFFGIQNTIISDFKI